MIPVAPELEGTPAIVLHDGEVVSWMATDRLVRPPPLGNATVIEGMAQPIFDRKELDSLGHRVSGTTMHGTDQRQDPVNRGPAGDGHVGGNSWRMPVLVPLYTSSPDTARSLDVRSSERFSRRGSQQAPPPHQRRHPPRSPSPRVQPWEKLRALRPHGRTAGRVHPRPPPHLPPLPRRPAPPPHA